MASQPARAGWLGGSAFSTVTHGVLIAAAVIATNHIPAAVREERAASPTEHITFVEPLKLLDVLHPKVAATPRKKSSTSTAPKFVAPNLSEIQDIATSIQIPDVTAAPDLTAVTDAWLSMPDSLSTGGQSVLGLLMATSGFVAPKNGIFTEDMVDRAVEPRKGNPKPRYPSSLARTGVEGDFMVRFVVDSAGTVPDDKIEFPSSMHRLFVAAVRTALLKSRYLPARLGGRAVAQQVIQEFRFKIGSR